MKLKKVMEHELTVIFQVVDVIRTAPKRLEKGTRRKENQRKNFDYLSSVLFSLAGILIRVLQI